MNYPVIILGAGGHAKVLIDTLRLRSVELLGIADADPAKKGQLLLGVPVIGGDEEITKYPAATIHLVNGIGSVRINPLRRRLFENFKDDGYQFTSAIHPSAIIAADAALSEGVQIMAGAVVQAGCRIGKNAIINTCASLDHDCSVSDHVHISPGATLSGGVAVGENSHIGTGATVIHGIKIGRNSLVAAGAVVILDVPDGVTVAGIPARKISP
jgi:sugar O-acyltransferase (sialic acid O-acetyltransferase NeuD family)